MRALPGVRGGRDVTRREMYCAARASLTFLHWYLILLFLFLIVVLTAGPEGRELTPLLIFFAAAAMASLWVKRAVVSDLLEGRTETVCGSVLGREVVADRLKFLWAEYLSVDTEAGILKLILFQSGPGRGLPGGRLRLTYLPRSKIVVQMEALEKSSGPPHRSKEWYREKPRREKELAELLKPRACRWCESYWFWERLYLLGPLTLCILCWVLKTICNFL